MMSKRFSVVVKCKPSVEGKRWRIGGTTLECLEAEGEEEGSPRENETLHFDNVFSDSASHSEFYEEAFAPNVSGVLRGHNVAFVTVGLPCSGKTHMVFGTAGQARLREEAKGVIYRCGKQLFDELQREENQHLFCRITATFCHIFEDGRVADLFDAKKRDLQVVDSSTCSSVPYAVTGLTEHTVGSPQDILRLTEKGYLMRNASGCTKQPMDRTKFSFKHNPVANPLQQYRPHASHAVFKYTIEVFDKNASAGTARNGSIVIVDLAGINVEKVASTSPCLDSGIKEMYKFLQEKGYPSATSSRDLQPQSTLMKILKHSLGGNCETVIAAAVSLDASSGVKSSLNYLRTLSDSRAITNSPKTNQVTASNSLLFKLLEEDENLKMEVTHKLGLQNETNEWEILGSSSVKINGTLHNELTPSCENILKKICTAGKGVLKGGNLLYPTTDIQTTAAGMAKPIFISSKAAVPKPRPSSSNDPFNNPMPTVQATLPKSDPSQSKPVPQPNAILEQTLSSTDTSSESDEESDPELPQPTGPQPPPLKGIPHLPPDIGLGGGVQRPSGPALLVRQQHQPGSSTSSTRHIVPPTRLPPIQSQSVGRGTYLLLPVSEKRVFPPSEMNSVPNSQQATRIQSHLPNATQQANLPIVNDPSLFKTHKVASLPIPVPPPPPPPPPQARVPSPESSTPPPPEGDISEPIQSSTPRAKLNGNSHSQSQQPVTYQQSNPNSTPIPPSLAAAALQSSATGTGIRALSSGPRKASDSDAPSSTDSDSLSEETCDVIRSVHHNQQIPSPIGLDSSQSRPTNWLDSVPQERPADYSSAEPPSYEQSESSFNQGQQYNQQVSFTDESRQTLSDSQGRQQGNVMEMSNYISSEEIHVAAMEGIKASSMKKLAVRFGVDYKDHAGRTPLMYAVLGNQPKMCEVLLNIGANVNAVDYQGLTPLLWSAYQAKPQVMKVLLRSGSNVEACDPSGHTAYHWAMKTPNIQCLKLLYKYASPGIINRPDDESLTPLHWAVMCEQPMHIKMLLSAADGNATSQDRDGRTPLTYAVMNSSLACIRAILDRREEVINLRDEKKRTSLHYACAESTEDCVRTLISYKRCDLRCTDDRGTTALHWAAAANRSQIVQLLLRHGLDRAQQDYDEKTAIDYAIQHGHTDCIRILQSYGIRRPASALSMAPPVSSASPQVLDEFGHVQMRRPNRTFSLSGEPTEEEQEPMSSANRLPADGQASHDGIQEEVSPSQCGDNAAHPHSEERGTSQTEQNGPVSSLFCCGKCCWSRPRRNVVVPLS